MKRSSSALARAASRGLPRPRPARGQAGVAPRARAMTCTCSCDTTLPSAAMLSLSQPVTALSARATRRDLGHQLRLLDLVEIDDLARRRPARHQQQPGLVGVVDDQHARQRQVADLDGVAGELRMQRPGRRWRRHEVMRYPSRCPAKRRRITRRAHSPAAVKASIGALLRACIPAPFRRYRAGRLAVDEPLANRVRSGRKQP